MRDILSSLLATVLLAAAIGVGAPPARAVEQVDILLVLAADVSRSVDDEKFKLQRDGYAAAIVDPRVIKAIESGPSGRIAICFVEWSGPANQVVIADWTLVGGLNDARRLSRLIAGAPRPFRDSTAIGSAIDFSVRQFERAGFASQRRVIDVSGDGTSNTGRSLHVAREQALEQGITINGLVILSEVPLARNPAHTHPPGGLLAYYENNVIGGPGAFAFAAESFESFGRSITSKLIKEIAAAPAGSVPNGPATALP